MSATELNYAAVPTQLTFDDSVFPCIVVNNNNASTVEAVSYTHLTLPTIYSV